MDLFTMHLINPLWTTFHCQRLTLKSIRPVPRDMIRAICARVSCASKWQATHGWARWQRLLLLES